MSINRRMVYPAAFLFARILNGLKKINKEFALRYFRQR